MSDALAPKIRPPKCLVTTARRALCARAIKPDDCRIEQTADGYRLTCPTAGTCYDIDYRHADLIF
jgi:hypothetical protein